MTRRIWNNESGVLTFEWILLITLLVIGIVGGLTVIRDAYIVEAAETAGAMTGVNQGYTIEGPYDFIISSKDYTKEEDIEMYSILKSLYKPSGSQSSVYTDAAGKVYVDAPGHAYENRDKK